MEQVDNVAPLGQLTPPDRAEVRRTLVIVGWAGVSLCAGLTALILAVTSDTTAEHLGVLARVFALCLVVVAFMLVGLILLAFRYDCWPALLRRDFLRTNYAVPADRLSWPAQGTYWKRSGFYRHFARGAFLGAGFGCGLWLIEWVLADRLPPLRFPLIMSLVAGCLAAQAWVVRTIVAESRARS